MNMNRGLNAYQSNQTRTRAEVADPYQMVKILFENLMDNLARAKGAIELKNHALKGETIGRSMDIINALRAGLDHSVNEEMTRNLDDLYQFCNNNLTQASMKNDLEALNDAVTIIQQLKSTWDQLGSPEREKAPEPEKTPDAAA
ncbi:flagellar export chaperone FliS [Endozoicomonas sp. OPT23]|uniref:flagellar export chaperone FliS n=1 Tax=Endozoicomonas sp. OPT23 TaxID=2072845 RepID=UPI00129BDA7F|nr:flagellar export chaperone FliS [Endozoicomonas sp. OPT23]MRI33917.1 flagellar export chaperone FliS [Endozoicomonas sp. OPT23]